MDPRRVLKTGLNPYGLGYTLGRQGKGTARANPEGQGLAGFIALGQEIGATTMEIAADWVTELDDPALDRLHAVLDSSRMTPVLSSGLHRGDFDACVRVARRLGAGLIRFALTPILCGDRAAAGPEWDRLVESVWSGLAACAPRAAEAGLVVVVENHQDFTSRELVAFCERFGPVVRIVLDTGNAFPVAEAPLDFARVVAPFVGYVHLKDYRIQPTNEGFRLVRCAIGDGAVPFAELATILAEHHPVLPAALEPGALDARHVRLFTPGWWRGYSPKPASELAACLLAARTNALAENEDHRTPWERGEDGILVRYELDMIRRSAANMRAVGLMGSNG